MKKHIRIVVASILLALSPINVALANVTETINGDSALTNKIAIEDSLELANTSTVLWTAEDTSYVGLEKQFLLEWAKEEEIQLIIKVQNTGEVPIQYSLARQATGGSIGVGTVQPNGTKYFSYMGEDLPYMTTDGTNTCSLTVRITDPTFEGETLGYFVQATKVTY